MERRTVRLDGFDPAIARRMATTVSCTDADDLPRVEGAGEVREVNGHRVQVMHNGLLVEEGGYFGAWMAEIIRTLRGHHEPQEELVFARIVERLHADAPGQPTMIEFGSHWTFYGLWFCTELAQARAVGLEPDPAYLEVGRRNAALNDLTDRVTFVHGAVGGQPGESLEFVAESDGQRHQVAQHDLASLMRDHDLDHVDLVLADIQGFETVLLDRARSDLVAGRVRFLIVSTHHRAISGDPLTHQKALRLLADAGAHVIAEHSVPESYSGDGLIAVSFDPRDRDLTVTVSHARSVDSLFGELEHEVAALQAEHAGAEHANAEHLAQELAHPGAAMHTDVDRTRAARDAAVAQRDAAVAERDAAVAELAAVRSTKLWRWSGAPRALYAKVARR